MALNRFGSIGPLAAMLVPLVASSDRQVCQASSGASVAFDTALAVKELFVFTCTVDCYLRQHATAATAAPSDGSMLVPAGLPILLDGAQGASVAAIAVGTTAGVMTLQKMAIVS